MAVVLLMTAWPASPTRAAYDEIGGDDVPIALLSHVSGVTPCIDIAEGGDIYVAVPVELAGGRGIFVYRSQDGGDAWNLWGSLSSTGAHYEYPSLHVAEGTTSRVYVAYSYQGPGGGLRQIRVAYSSLTVSSAAWSETTVLSTATDDFIRPCLNSDEMNFLGYRLYLAAEGDDGNGHDIWFARSTTYGATWEAGYKIGSLATGDYYSSPYLCYGRAGVVHCAWTFNPVAHPTVDHAVRYRRAQSYAGGGLADWDPILYLTTSSDGYDDDYITVAASHAGNSVVVTYDRSVDNTSEGCELRSSADAGVTWAGTDKLTLPFDWKLQCLSLPGTGDFLFCGAHLFHQDGLMSSPDETPLALSDHQTLGDRDYYLQWGSPASNRHHDYDPTRGNRRAMIWLASNDAGADTVYFDAEWRSDPGYPNLEAGFPRALTAGVVAPPALCELDGDVESEIVFGDLNGYIHVVNHDGTPVPGWPIDIGTFQSDATIAVGDLTGNGDNEVVAGNDAGYIHAFDAAGDALAGWPRYIGVSAPVYVAIGPISTPARQVVACGGTKVALYNASGSPVPGFPMTTGGTISAAPAIGDLDGDGDREIVVLQSQFMDSFRGNGTVQSFRNVGGDGQTFSNAPTLADLNFDGDLEIMAPTDQGRLYVMNPDGTDYPGGWPYDEPLGSRLTSVALAQIRGTTEPELIFAVEDPNHPKVHAFYQNMTELGGYPRLTEMDWFLYAAPIVDVLDEGSPDVVVAARDRTGYAWDNFGADLPGWPRGTNTRVHVSAASGDIDGDGRVEVVFAGYSPASLVVYDLGALVERPASDPLRWWPMYGYNAMRQGCLACGGDVVSGVGEETGPVALLHFAPPSPNPASGAVGLHFDLPEPATVRLDALDVQGRLVARVLKSELGGGPHDVVWDPLEGGRGVAAGVYYLRLGVSGARTERVLIRKVVLMR